MRWQVLGGRRVGERQMQKARMMMNDDDDDDECKCRIGLKPIESA
jgi:hypothetical protein